MLTAILLIVRIGTTVVGNGAMDGVISKNEYSHPLSMPDGLNYQHSSGKATGTDPGYYPMGCARQVDHGFCKQCAKYSPVFV